MVLGVSVSVDTLTASDTPPPSLYMCVCALVCTLDEDLCGYEYLLIQYVQPFRGIGSRALA